MGLKLIGACSVPLWVDLSHHALIAIKSLSFPLTRPLWNSIYTKEFASAAALADLLFAETYMQPDLCEEGFVLSTIFRLIPFAIADREGWVERFSNVLHRYSAYRQNSILVGEYWDLLEAMRLPKYSTKDQIFIINTLSQSSEFKGSFHIADGHGPQCYFISEETTVISSQCVSRASCISILLPVRTLQLKYLAQLASDASDCLASEMVSWIDRNPFPVEQQGLQYISGNTAIISPWIENYSDGIETSFLTSSNRCRELVSEIQTKQNITLNNNTITVLNYASGCCEEAQKKNTASAYACGANVVHALNRDAIDQTWAQSVDLPIARSIGGGFWIWKPRIILDQLERMEPGEVLVYLDAGNFFNAGSSLRQLVSEVLQYTDVAAPFLPCCLESDWTKRDVMYKLKATESKYNDTPQIGAFLILFRKSHAAIQFVTKWLQLCMQPHLLTDSPSNRPNHPTFVKHTHDQSLFSVLFKKSGFVSFPMKTADLFVTLARWRN